jgi:hypothetical protein
VDVIATIEKFAFLAIYEAGLSGVQIDILESLHDLGSHDQSSFRVSVDYATT